MKQLSYNDSDECDQKDESSPRLKGPPRRSRSTLEGRDWQCQYCRKQYLSSNSLIYHVRQKHKNDPSADQFIRSQFKSSIYDQNTMQEVQCQIKSRTQTNQSESVNNMSQLQAPQLMSQSARVYPLENFDAIVRMLQESDLIQVVHNQNQRKHPLYSKIEEIMISRTRVHEQRYRGITNTTQTTQESLVQKVSASSSCAQQEQIPHLSQIGQESALVASSQGHIIERNCESALAQYLLWLTKSVDQSSYDEALKHVLLYRDCMNELGYLKLTQLRQENIIQDVEEEEKEPLTLLDDANTPQQNQNNSLSSNNQNEFVKLQDADFIPELCNEFILHYCEERKSNTNMQKKHKMIKMTDRMCNWLFNQGFTTSRLLKQTKKI